MNIHAILSALINLGPKLPEVIGRLEAIMSEVSALIALVKGEQPMFGECPMEPGEAALCEQAENQLAACSTLYAGPGDRIKALLGFLKEHPELLDWLLKKLV